MGTRSYIAVQTGANIFSGVYCHWDGNLRHNGRILFDHYNKRPDVLRLIQMGDMSVLGPKIGTKHSFEEATYKEDSPHYNECTFYARDRGEDTATIAAVRHNSLLQLFKAAENCGAEYLYVFDLKDRWLWASRGAQFFGGSDGSKLSALYRLTEKAIGIEQWMHDCYIAERDGKPKPPRPTPAVKSRVVFTRDMYFTDGINIKRTGGVR